MLVCVIHKEFDEKYRIYLYAVALLYLIYLFSSVIKDNGSYKMVLLDVWREKKWLVLLLAMTVILSYDSNMYQFKWDGLQYYHVTAHEAHLSSLSSVAMFGHISLFSGAWYRLWASLIGNTGYGMATANVVLLLISIVAFCKLIETIAPGKRTGIYVIASTCYAFSPYLLGMVNYYSIDYAAVCLMPILLWCVFKEYWVLTVLAGCAFCFSKEPAVIAYSGTALGLVLYDFVRRQGTLKTKTLCIIRSKHYYFMLIPVVLWFAAYKYMGRWNGGENGVYVDFEYIVNKIKVFCVLSYNWVWFIVIVSGIIASSIRGKLEKSIQWLLPMLTSNICLLFFNCIFVTVNHPRYIDSFVSTNIAMAIGILLSLKEDKIKRAVNVSMILMGGLSLLSCFVSIDPVSYLMFDSNYVGDARLYTTSTLKTGDASIYNKQMLWCEKALDMALNEAIKEDTDIVISVSGGSIYSNDGMSLKFMNDKFIDTDTLYWDSKNERRLSFTDELIGNENVEKIDIYHMASGEGLNDIRHAGMISVIYIKGISDYNIPDEYSLVDSKDYSYRGWTITRDIIKHK